MKKLMIFGAAICVAMAFTGCKSSESAYKKAYEKAKAQERTGYTTEETATRVVAATFDNKASAVQSRNQLRNQYPDAWLLSK